MLRRFVEDKYKAENNWDPAQQQPRYMDGRDFHVGPRMNHQPAMEVT